MTRRLAESKKELMAAIMSSDASAVVEKALATQKLTALELPQENILSSLVFSDINNRQDRIEEPGHSTYEWIDRSMQCPRSVLNERHWSDEICGAQYHNTSEHGNRDLRGHVIEFTDHVLESLTANPALLGAKKGRPYLDYVLRYDPATSFRHFEGVRVSWSTLSGDLLMVETLLDLGCDVNERINIYEGRTVWELYLAFIYEKKPVK